MRPSLSRAVLLSGSAIVTIFALSCGAVLSQTPDQPPAGSQTQPTPAVPAQTSPTPPAAPQAQPAPGGSETQPGQSTTTPSGGTTLPEVKVETIAQPPRRIVRATRRTPPPPATATPPQPSAAQQIQTQAAQFEGARSNLYAPLGTMPYTVSRGTIEALPQGSNAPIDKVLLQAPGVTQDSAASGNLHVRNEHANLQYRINGIMLPDGVAAFGSVLDTGFIGSLALITGAMPAQFGLRTAGVIDITTPSQFDNGGSVSIYGGSHQSFTPSFDYGGSFGGNCGSTNGQPYLKTPSTAAVPCPGATQYFFTGRYLENNLGLENPTPSSEAIHDFTQQVSGFGYMSTVLDSTTRLSFIGGTSTKKYQIPDNPGQPPQFTAFGMTDFDSSLLNENQIERNHFGVLALQKSVENIDLQLAYFSQYSSVHFLPDPVGDLMFNGVATDVFRSGFTNGVQADGSIRINESHTVRTGFSVNTEKTQVTNSSQLLPFDNTTDPSTQLSDVPFGVADASSKVGWLLGAYVQDEWKITDQLTLNSGLRFDQMYQYVDADQLSPRFSLTYKPRDTTTFHISYARNFTPPVQVVAAPTNTALFTGTVQEPGVPGPYGAMMPERSNVFDAGVSQIVMPGLLVSLDAYYKYARDLIDDGQFGAAYVLNGFNYDKAYNVGVELAVKYTNGNFSAYGNLAWAKQMATNVVSNQYLFDPDELAYIQNNWINTDHAQLWTGSAGVSYLWDGTRFSTDMIFGSGLRSGFANTDHVPAYTQFNLGVSHDFNIWNDCKAPGPKLLVKAAPSTGCKPKPLIVRFDVVNVFDTSYVIRDGSGIGVFAPQYGPRRGYFAGITQKF